MKRQHGLSPAQRGFSMIEMMVVLVIMGIVLAAAVPNVTRYMRHDQVRGAADNFRAQCMLAQKRTMATRIPHRVVYNPAAGAYYVERLTGGGWVFASSDSTRLAPGLEMDGGVIGDPSHHVITFDPRGTVDAADVPATIRFTNALQDSSIVRIVRTGRMVIENH